jgi:hypothetical protein
MEPLISEEYDALRESVRALATKKLHHSQKMLMRILDFRRKHTKRYKQPILPQLMLIQNMEVKAQMHLQQ